MKERTYKFIIIFWKLTRVLKWFWLLSEIHLTFKSGQGSIRYFKIRPCLIHLGKLDIFQFIWIEGFFFCSHIFLDLICVCVHAYVQVYSVFSQKHT